MAGTKSATYDFTGSTVLITGGGTGIGLAITRAFLAAGANVAIVGRHEDVLAKALADAPAERSLAVPADIRDVSQVRSLVSTVIDRLGSLDVVVSNAAAFTPGPITALSDEDWADMRSTNVDGFFFLAREVLPLLAGRGGNFIATSSVSGLAGDWGMAAYTATKGAISNFVRSLALDWGSQGVRVNAVAPTLTDTDAISMVTGDPTARAAFENRIALGRIAQPEDVASAVLWLASDGASFVTGTILTVEGGLFASNGQPHIV